MIAALIVTFISMTQWVLADTPVPIPNSGLYSAPFDASGQTSMEENMATHSYLCVGNGSYLVSDLAEMEYAYNLNRGCDDADLNKDGS